MQDEIILGNGNSRYLKSSLSSETTWEQALAMLQNGTFPIDFNGKNVVGILQQGTPLNKNNLLSDATAEIIFGSSEQDYTPDNALAALKGGISDVETALLQTLDFEIGSYVGTGDITGSRNSVVSVLYPIVFHKKPTIFCVIAERTINSIFWDSQILDSLSVHQNKVIFGASLRTFEPSYSEFLPIGGYIGDKAYDVASDKAAMDNQCWWDETQQKLNASARIRGGSASQATLSGNHFCLDSTKEYLYLVAYDKQT